VRKSVTALSFMRNVLGRFAPNSIT
jgi:hypothetical protein